MPTEPAHVIAARANAQARPLATAGAHLRHLVNAIRYTDEHAATHGGHLTIKTEEAEAVAAVVLDLAAKPATPIYLAVYIGTTNNTSGNPRRGWYVSRLDGQPVIPEVPPNGRNSGKDAAYTCWVEEGYSGSDALLLAACPPTDEDRTPMLNIRAWRDRARALVHETGRIEVTPGEYRDARKLPRFGGAS